MYFKNIIGQDKIKNTIDEMCKNMYVPPCQLFIDKNGYGGLGLALYFCLQLIYGKENLKKHLSRGSDLKKILQNPDLKFIYPVYSNKNMLSSDYLKEWKDNINYYEIEKSTISEEMSNKEINSISDIVFIPSNDPVFVQDLISRLHALQDTSMIVFCSESCIF